AVEAEGGLLDDFLRFARAAEHPVGDREALRPQPIEQLFVHPRAPITVRLPGIGRSRRLRSPARSALIAASLRDSPRIRTTGAAMTAPTSARTAPITTSGSAATISSAITGIANGNSAIVRTPPPTRNSEKVWRRSIGVCSVARLDMITPFVVSPGGGLRPLDGDRPVRLDRLDRVALHLVLTDQPQ